MKPASPLRYPGGKSSFAGLLSNIRKINNLGNRSVVEPFAGGAGAALSLLFLEETHEITINDADPAIYDFWWTLTNRPQPFLKMLSSKPVNMTEWRRQRDIYRSKEKISRLQRGFSAFYLNRCNRSGIIMNGGPIGGVHQKGRWKIDARFNKDELLKRCGRVAEYRERIKVTNLDGAELIKGLDSKAKFLFIDPPYFVKGPSLYLNSLDADYHSKLADTLKGIESAAWVLTYDDCPEIRRLYRGWATIRPFTLSYAASVSRRGNELMIVPKWMRLPKFQRSSALDW